MESFAPFFKVILAFGCILVGIRLKWGLALSILIGGWLMGLLFGMPVFDCLRTSFFALGQEKFLFLASIVGLILILSDALDRSGQSKRLMEALSGYLLRPKLRLVFFPALIGLLPMPGGAVFSAPMVKAVSEKMGLGQEQLALINYWFRHIWELAWPLYPGIILTVALADITVGELISRSWPGVVAMVGLGWFFFLRGDLGMAALKAAQSAGTAGAAAEDDSVLEGVRSGSNGHAGQASPLELLQSGLPLLIAIFGAVGLESLLAQFAPHIPFELGVITALTAAVICVMVQNKLGRDFFISVIGKKSLHSMLLVVAAIFVFKDVMQAAGIVEAMSQAAGERVALFSAAVFLPFLVGMVAGINVAFVGATFPLLIGLLRQLGMEAEMVPYLILASFAGFSGVMVSPIHICFVLTCDYFGVNVFTTWRRLVAPSVGFALCGALLFFLLKSLA